MQLVRCKQVSRFYNNFIQETPSLNQSVQYGEYVLLAKQTAELIPDAHWKQMAYCAIATLEAKSNPEEAKQTLRLAKQAAELIQNDFHKALAYSAIAIKQAKLNPEEAKQTADLIQNDCDNDYYKLETYCAIAAALLPQ